MFCAFVCVPVWYQIRLVAKNQIVSDPSKLDTFFHKTCSLWYEGTKAGYVQIKNSIK